MRSFEALIDENAVLARELAAAQQRSTRHSCEQASRIEALQGEVLRLRAQVIARDTAVAALVEERQTLEAVATELRRLAAAPTAVVEVAQCADDETLAAADLVICQTGCISHEAYWRVKDHCKRTGKRCVLVESPSSAGLKLALLAIVPSGGGDSMPPR